MDILKILVPFLTSIILIYTGYYINRQFKIKHLKNYLSHRIEVGLNNYPKVINLLNEISNEPNNHKKLSNLLIINNLPKEFAKTLIEIDLPGMPYYAEYLEKFETCIKRIDQLNETSKRILFEFAIKSNYQSILETQLESLKNELIEFAYSALELLKYLKAKDKTFIKNEFLKVHSIIDKLSSNSA